MERPSIPGVIRGKLGCQGIMIFHQHIHEVFQLFFIFKHNLWNNWSKEIMDLLPIEWVNFDEKWELSIGR